MNKTLYLCSGSLSRKKLLEVSKIPFNLISHNADETIVSLNQPLQEVVTQIALLKIDHILLPQGRQGDVAFFLTADTLTKTVDGSLLSKPADKQEAIEMLKKCRSGAIVGTAFCLEKRIFEGGSWVPVDRVIGYEQGWCLFDVPDNLMDFYLDSISCTDVSGGVTIEGFGEQFLKEVRGSYSAILGLPMYQVREALQKFGFFL